MRVRSAVAGLVLLLAAAPLAAQTTSVSNVLHSGVAFNGVYVGWYEADVPYLGGPGTDVICVDYTRISKNYTASVTGLVSVADGGDYSETRQGPRGDKTIQGTTYNPFERYWMSAWLATKFQGMSTGSGGENWGVLHYAIWRTASGDPLATIESALPGSLSGAQEGAVETWITDARMALAGGDDIGQWVVLGANGQDAQEYMSQVPEPAAMLLLLTGLGGVIGAGAVRRRRTP